MLKINTKQVLKNFKQEALKNGTDDLTIGMVVSSILGGKVSNPYKGWILGKRFATEKEVELKAEDVVFLKKEIEASEAWLAVVTGQLIEMLDGGKE